MTLIAFAKSTAGALTAAVALVCFAGVRPVFGAAQMTFYLSPTGRDSNDGRSLQTAFATLGRARDAVRTVNGDMTGDIIVDIARGDYPVAATIELDARDSGTHGFNVIYKSHDGPGSARFLGGRKVTAWAPFRNNIYQAHLKPGLQLTTLYEDGIRADLARWPKRTSPFATSRAGYLTLTDTHGACHFVDSAPSPDGTPFDATGKDFSSAWLYFWDGEDGHRWSSATSAVGKIENGVVRLKNGGPGGAPDSFLIEGSLGLLTRPGEFFYDKTTGNLYYCSRFPGPIQKQEVLAPIVVRVLGVVGASPTEAVHDVKFEGLAFVGTDRIAASGLSDWTDSRQSSWDAAVFLKNARDIAFANCKIADAGVCGITADSDTEHCTVTGCLIEHTGYHGVSLINGAGHTVRNCLIRDVGELRGHGDGASIMYDPHRPDGKSVSPHFTSHTLSNLEIYNSPRAGVAVRGRGDVIQFVKVHDCVQDSGDQGAFYLVDPAADATFNQCTSFHNYVDLSCMDRPPTAVYNDRDAPGTTWSNIDAGDSQMFVFRHDPQKNGTLTFNNVNWKMELHASANQAAAAANPAFSRAAMQYDKIGVTADFPREYNDLASAPPAPLNVWGQAGHGQATVHWTQADRAAAYTIQRSNTQGGPYRIVASVTVPAKGWGTGTHYTDPDVTDGTNYYYVVTAQNKAGESPLSLEVAVTPGPGGSNLLTGSPVGAGGDFHAALDKNLATTFESKNGWAGLDLGSPRVITAVGYSPRSDNTDTTARMCGGEFQGANELQFTNPVTFFKVLATKGGVGTPVMITQAIYNKTAVRYVRYIGPSGKTTIAEAQWYGHPPTAAAP